MGRLALLVSGLLFSVGLAAAGMTDANKVLGFLDVSGGWDPSLALVMVGAIGVHALVHRLAARRQRPLFDARFHGPTNKTIDGRLVAGAALFGAGWGLAGYCPGPVLVSVVTGALVPLVFVLTMSLGWWLAARAEASADG